MSSDGDGPILDFDALYEVQVRVVYHRVASVAAVRPGRPFMGRVGIRRVALFNLDGEIFALSNTCPHAGGDLGMGKIVGRRVVCPRHEWAFDVATGECAGHDVYRARSYPVEIREGQVYVGIEEEG